MSQLTFERWLPVVSHAALYEVSDLGRVRSLRRKSKRGLPGRIINGRPTRQGYLRVILCDNGQRTDKYIHVLVLEAFIGPCPDGMETRHLDGNNGNNSLPNLVWGTPVENNQDRVRHGTHPQSSRTHCPQEHEYTEANTYRDPKGSRHCRECGRQRCRDRRLNLAA